MVSAHLLNFAILFAPMIGTFAGEKMNSAVVSYATVAILLLGIMFWRQMSYCKEKGIDLFHRNIKKKKIYKDFFPKDLL